MMSLEGFTEDVIKEIRERAGSAFQIKEQDVTKNNNVKKTGFAVMKEGADIGQCVYLDEFYREYESDGMRFDEIVDEVYRMILGYERDVPNVDISGFREWETVHGDIYPKLINAGENKELLEKIPHRLFLDLAVVYYAVARDHAQTEIGTILIYNGHMEKWGRDEENLYQTALMNMRDDGEMYFENMETVINNILPENVSLRDETLPHPHIDMYILTNRRKCYGASEILDRNTLRMVAEKLGDGFIVLPSSVHETIMLSPKDGTGYEKLAEMVKEVNDTQVCEEERLSYHVYVYSRDEETLKIVA